MLSARRWGLGFGIFAAAAYAAEPDIARLQDLVEMNSGSQNSTGVRAVEKRVERYLVDLGFSVSYVENPRRSARSAPLLVAVRKGEASPAERRFVTLITHADTVFEPAAGFLHFSKSADGKFLQGPGIGDDKGGIVIALAGLRRLRAAQSKFPYSIRFVCAPSEEIGSPGFGDSFRDFARDSVMALGFEDAPASGALAESRSGIAKYEIRVHGREAHAGTHHREGANACVTLSQELTELSRLTDYGRGITVNVGSIAGGSAKTNIVCGEASAKVEFRYPTPEIFEEVQAKFDRILKAKAPGVETTEGEGQGESKGQGEGRRSSGDGAGSAPAVTEYTMDPGRGSFPANSRTRPYLAKYRELLTRLEGHAVDAAHEAGSADISFMAGPELIAIDGLGPIGGAAHTREERILKSSLETRAQALAEFLAWFARGRLDPAK